MGYFSVAGIYLITIMELRRWMYVGQAVDIQRRFCQHETRLQLVVDWKIRAHSYHGRILERVEGLEGDELKAALNEREIHWIAKLDTFLGDGYNMHPGGNAAGASEDTRRKMRIAHTGKKFTLRHRERLRIVSGCRKHSRETRVRMSIVRQGEGSYTAKLTRLQVIEILGLFFVAGWRQVDLGRRFEVSRECIRQIVRGEKWKEVYKEYHANNP